MGGWMNGQVEEWMDGWKEEICIDGWMDGCWKEDGWMDGRKEERWTDRKKDEWIDGRVDERKIRERERERKEGCKMVGWMDGQLDREYSCSLSFKAGKNQFLVNLEFGSQSQSGRCSWGP